MPQHAAQQRPRSAAEVNPSAPDVHNIRAEAAALRAAQAAGTQSRPSDTVAQLDAFFARRRVRPRAPLRTDRSSDALARRGSRRFPGTGVEAGGRALGALLPGRRARCRAWPRLGVAD